MTKSEIKKFKKDVYKIYQMKWLMSRNIALDDIINYLYLIYNNACKNGDIGPDTEPVDDFTLISDVMYENGFNGEFFVSEDEFFNNEYKDTDYMDKLLADNPKKLATYYALLILENSENLSLLEG